MLIDEYHNDGSLDLRLGEIIDLVLTESPTAGFRWRLESGGTPNLTCLDDTFQPGAIPGAPGRRQWRFQAMQPGSTTIRLSYARSWEQQAARSYTVRVRVTRIRRGSLRLPYGCLNHAYSPEVARQAGVDEVGVRQGEVPAVPPTLAP